MSADLDSGPTMEHQISKTSVLGGKRFQTPPTLKRLVKIAQDKQPNFKVTFKQDN
ncbi:MAG: hypothetical protein GY782_06775 [Gammaproteobacteria bacterium]|nr:hypothetical protein [Gammaproteobacteria bacterium]